MQVDKFILSESIKDKIEKRVTNYNKLNYYFINHAGILRDELLSDTYRYFTKGIPYISIDIPVDLISTEEIKLCVNNFTIDENKVCYIN